MAELLTSLNNPKVKNVLKLQQKSAERKIQNLTVVEGFREIMQALTAGCVCHSAYICSEIAGPEKIEIILKNVDQSVVFYISESIFEKLAYRDNSDGILILAEPRQLKLENVKLPGNPLVLVFESVEKPGNLGAMLRTADAAGVDLVLVCNQPTDLYNPNTIRASLGTIFSKQVVACTSEQAIRWLREKNIRTYCAAIPSETSCYDVDYSNPSAIIMGSEAKGLSGLWIKNADEIVMIPMYGKVDSLNVSASAAILLYEAVRQRKDFLKPLNLKK